jgi:uncharacterized ion transporter superfamily protein YfcC
VICFVLENLVIWGRQKTNKHQTTSTKLQTNHKYQAPRQKDGGQANYKQIPNYKFQTRAKTIFLFFCLLFVFSVIGVYLLFGISPFGYWILFGICNLVFVISIIQ